MDEAAYCSKSCNKSAHDTDDGISLVPRGPYRHQRGLTSADWAQLLDLVTSGDLRVTVTVTTATGSSAVVIGAAQLAALEHAAAADHRRADRVVLTPREREVLEHVASGASTAEVADRLDLAASTVTAHLSSARRKYGVRSSAEAAARVRPRGDSGVH